MNVRRGEVVLVDFPYSDHTGSKVRPALVVQADALNRRLDDTILALITSSRHRRVGAATQFAIDITTPEGQQTGLRLNSVIQCENLLTYDQALILRVLGRLSATSMEQIDAVSKLHWAFRRGVRGLCDGLEQEDQEKESAWRIGVPGLRCT
jgi:mRNA interferase MazF